MAKKELFTKHSSEDIDRFVTQTREELRNLRFTVAGSKNQNVKHARNLRHQIARALTERTNRASQA